ncbi:MAG TPA: hypothetical protein VF089_16515 [Candidatus Binatia bacterium]
MIQARALSYFIVTAALLVSTRLIGETAEISDAQIRQGVQVALQYTLSDETGAGIIWWNFYFSVAPGQHSQSPGS